MNRGEPLRFVGGRVAQPVVTEQRSSTLNCPAQDSLAGSGERQNLRGGWRPTDSTTTSWFKASVLPLALGCGLPRISSDRFGVREVKRLASRAGSWLG